MYCHDRVMIMEDRSIWPSTGRVACAHFKLQPGIPQDRCISVHLQGTNLDKQQLIKSRRTATLNGGMLSVVQQYLLAVAEMIEGCQTDNVDIITWNEQSHPVVRCSRMLSSIGRHDKDFRMDTFSAISLLVILTKRKSTLTPGTLLALVCTAPRRGLKYLTLCTA